MKTYSRREAAKLMALASSSLMLTPALANVNIKTMLKRKIPSSGDLLPVVGCGTWQTFDVGNNSEKRAQLSQVLLKMNALGGTVIDSSPMYGSSEAVVGDLTKSLKLSHAFFYATKVWTHGKQQGITQMQNSFKKFKRPVIDLMQIHNLVDWQTHVKTLRAWKGKGKIKYWGITHYTNASHNTLADIITKEHPDFVQFNYAINDLNAEKRLLKTAQDQGVAVIINRPYNGGTLFRKVKGKTLPSWCAELDINSWGQFFLKYILSHNAVNCVIPGTSKPHHAIDNMNAGYGKLPDEKQRKDMLSYFQNL